MQLSKKGAAFIAAHEGFVPTYYLDPVGIPTIGIGFTWRSGAFKKWWAKNRPGQEFGPGTRMTREEAQDALIFLCKTEYGAAVTKALGKLKQNVYDACVSVCYNLGPRSLQWKWAKAVESGDLKRAAQLLRTTGTTAKGVKLRGLVRRRSEEAALLLAGYEGKADPVADDEKENLRRGMRGVHVEGLQESLKLTGDYVGAVDGVFGPGTQSALMAFQRRSGLMADGVFGDKTKAAVLAALQASKPPEPAAKPQGIGAIIAAIIRSIFGGRS